MFCGFYHDDLMGGNGKFIWSDGIFFECENFLRGLRNGKCQFVNTDGDKLVCHYENNLFVQELKHPGSEADQKSIIDGQNCNTADRDMYLDELDSKEYRYNDSGSRLTPKYKVEKNSRSEDGTLSEFVSANEDIKSIKGVEKVFSKKEKFCESKNGKTEDSREGYNAPREKSFSGNENILEN